LGLLLSAGAIGLSINITENDDNLTKVSELHFSSKDPLFGNSTRIDVVRSEPNNQTSNSTENGFVGWDLRIISASATNILGLLIFIVAFGSIIFIHYYARGKFKLYRQVTVVYNYFARLIHRNHELNIDVDELQFLVGRVMYDNIDKRIVDEPINIKGNKSGLPVCKAYMVAELDGSTYSHWVVISGIGILLLPKIQLARKEDFYFEHETQLDTELFVYRNIHPNDVDKIKKDFGEFSKPRE
jgi:hypothetical protein